MFNVTDIIPAYTCFTAHRNTHNSKTTIITISLCKCLAFSNTRDRYADWNAMTVKMLVEHSMWLMDAQVYYMRGSDVTLE